MAQPNILLFITDQHRADHLGCYGNPVVRTPAIDGIAARGRRFERFYVASPICMPNRASLMTGRMPSLHGVRHNGIALALDSVTFPELLAAAGYRTALVGKSHLQNMTGRPPRVAPAPEPGKAPPAAELREADRRLRRGSAYDMEAPERWRDPTHEVRLPFYGFEEAHVATNHGDLVGGDYRRWLAARHPDPASLVGEANALPDNRRIAPQAWRTRVPEELYPTRYVEELAEEYLDRHGRERRHEPFFLEVSFPDPHHPFTPPGRYWEMYDPDRVALPASFGKGDNPALRSMRERFAAGEANRAEPTPFAVTAEEARVAIALTYGMITMIDDAIGRILERLVAAGLAQNTVVIFTSDHGDFMGDHGILLKNLLHYQGLIRVPFLWADPAGAGGLRRDLAGTLDIARTVLARAGLSGFNGMQGRDLFDASVPAPQGMIVEEDGAAPAFGFAAADRVRTLVTERWRLSLHMGQDWGELYDLERDPEENDNLWGRAPEVEAVLERQMLRRLIELQDRSPWPTGRA